MLAWYILPAAFMVDLILGDPRFLPHPVRWMGKTIEVAEPRFRKIPADPIIAGALFAVGLITGTWLLTYFLLVAVNSLHPMLKNAFEIIFIYYCISAGSLEEAALEIKHLLKNKDITGAREKVALVVGRDVTSYRETDIARATVETVAENLVDGVVSPLFYAAIGGAPLAMAYKMVNTLDSMVGYKNEKYMNFGRVSARIDDVLNYIPARLAVPIVSLATHILSGKGASSLKTAIREGANHSSPNAGFPEAAFAGALSVKLNGPNFYNGKLVDKPFIGIRLGNTSTKHIKKACDIMMLSSFLWLLLVWGTSMAL
ncbi:MAG: adenosylcobinamide-phosphate synthase CbiB [Desulfobacteraceae bacterium]|jgi:adenosylcobinamide-phosphate synthase|nr:adenosylcobinamide-phosphate synthase CbiB [Desulfobacteraceae bacterium]